MKGNRSNEDATQQRLCNANQHGTCASLTKTREGQQCHIDESVEAYGHTAKRGEADIDKIR